MTVEEGVQQQIKAMPKEIAGHTLAGIALVLARGLDSDAPLSSRSLAAKELRETLIALEKLAPAKKAKNQLDELRSRRTTRRSGAPNPARSPGRVKQGTGSD